MEGFKWDEKKVTAYSLFYLPTNALKLIFLLNQLSPRVIEKILETSVIDVGTGPGTYLIALKKYLHDNGFKNPLSMMGVDIEPIMLKQAQSLLKDEPITFLQDFSHALRLKDKKTFIFGNCLNELSAFEIRNWLKDIDGEFLFFIEPGTPREFEKMMLVRDILVKERGYNVLYPCPDGKLSCPIRDRESDWCHQVLRETHHPSIERLSQLVQLDRKVMPFIGHIYTKENFKKKNRTAHFVRFLRETKFSFEWEVCLQENQALDLVTFEIMKKDLKKKEVKEMKKKSVGETFDFKITKELNSQKLRVKLC